MSLTQHLGALEATGLIRLAQQEPEIEYLFRHALIQEAAYSSLVRQDRRRLHRAIGETLERMYPQSLDELASLLGRHFVEGGDETRAVKYFVRAGDAAFRLYALPEAIEHYRRALQLAQSPRLSTEAQDGIKRERLHHLARQLGRALELSSQFEAAIQHYEDLGRLGREQGDRGLELAAMTAQATIYATANRAHDPARGRALLDAALELAHGLDDRRAEARILWNLLHPIRPGLGLCPTRRRGPRDRARLPGLRGRRTLPDGTSLVAWDARTPARRAGRARPGRSRRRRNGAV